MADPLSLFRNQNARESNHRELRSCSVRNEHDFDALHHLVNPWSEDDPIGSSRLDDGGTWLSRIRSQPLLPLIDERLEHPPDRRRVGPPANNLIGVLAVRHATMFPHSRRATRVVHDPGDTTEPLLIAA
jgi:hypothetical protein